ncbi:isoprenylcysteine carboxylmethyltransferase family protein [Agromyces sp. C10]|uniref:methyltransferase family protein n=1 Tax=Agromyces sp. C10 TaxID=2935077 RepID=UPI00200A1C8E|nr:isoprenylcysteine carboxylmethyltransferase family protein [Agromyces sp. C10]MCK8608341.1 isoprenylcysteine carboxylmethyltransferase family protein [Agromyces sp. C10]
MQLREQLKSIDVERVVLVPALVLLLLLTVLSLLSGVERHASSGLAGYLYVAYLVLLIAFYVIAVVLLVVRAPAKAERRGFAPRAAAYLGTFLPMTLAFAGGSEVPDGVAVFAVVLMTLGMAFTVYSLVVLGRSFGVEAKVRTLVQHGPYRLIRNPLYVGEMVVLAGAVCFSPSLAKVGILIVIGAIQVYRAIQEERLLEEHVPEYTAYKLRTKRFVPGLF